MPVRATSSGGEQNFGVLVQQTSVTMHSVLISATGGTWSCGVAHSGGTVKINNSVIKGESKTISGWGSIQIGNSQLDGGDLDDFDTSDCKCAGIYEENYVFYPYRCP